MQTVVESPSIDKAKALRQTIGDSLDALAQAVDEVRASEAFRAFLDVQAKFHRYSWHNSMLILAQYPEASRVAGFQKWRELGRFVRKGERGIAIFAPCTAKRTETDEVTGEDVERKRLYFRIVHVFDVAQTDGEALPMLDVPSVESAADVLLASLERVANKRGIAVAYVETRDGHYGTSKGGSIDIATGHATGQQSKTLAHELAHETLHHVKGLRIDRNQAELEAESVAYVVCRHFGLDVEVRASRYIALWGGNAEALRESLSRIADTARGIIDDVESQSAERQVA